MDEKSELDETNKISNIFNNETDNINFIYATTRYSDYLFNEINHVTEGEELE